MNFERVDQCKARFRLRVVTDGDPSTLPRVLGYFQNLNITPHRVSGCFEGTRGHFEIDVSRVTEQRIGMITARVGEYPGVIQSSWSFI
jgi:hypothetical protein